MQELIIICNPHKTFIKEPEENVSKDYTKMAIEDYDKLITFNEKYMPFIETPDYTTQIGQKKDRNIILTLFSQQPIIKVETLNREFVSSSYLFNPESKNKKSLLPDLDVVQIEGNSELKEAANAIKRFYDNHSWKTYIFDGKITDTIKVASNSGRFKEPIQIINPEFLRQIAKEKTKYSLTELCF